MACKAKFPIASCRERELGIDYLLNGFIQAHFSLESTWMRKIVNENCNWTENMLLTWVQGEVYWVIFAYLSLVIGLALVISFVWSREIVNGHFWEKFGAPACSNLGFCFILYDAHRNDSMQLRDELPELQQFLAPDSPSSRGEANIRLSNR